MGAMTRQDGDLQILIRQYYTWKDIATALAKARMILRLARKLRCACGWHQWSRWRKQQPGGNVTHLRHCKRKGCGATETRPA